MKFMPFNLLRTLCVLLVALLVGFIIVLIVSEDPLGAYRYFLLGPLVRMRRVIEWLHTSIPMVFTGLAVSLVFRARQFNIGAEGQFLVGAAGATFVALHFPQITILHISVIMLFAMTCGALWGAVPGFMKAKFNASELVSSLMMNFVGFFVALYFVNHYFRDIRAGFMVSYRFPATAWLPDLMARPRLHGGLVLAAITAGLVWWFLYRTKWGYELRMTGMNIKFAEYAGINTKRVIVYTQVISGALAALGGAVELMGIHRRFLWIAMPGFGFDGIVVALLARNNPLNVLFAALFIGYLRSGARIMERMSDVTAEMAVIIQAIVILLVTAEALFSLWERRRIEREALKGG